MPPFNSGVPNYSVLNNNDLIVKQGYVVESVISGRDAIIEYLGETAGYGHYADMIKWKKLLIEPGPLDKISLASLPRFTRIPLFGRWF